jgi:hypothetical protein
VGAGFLFATFFGRFTFLVNFLLAALFAFAGRFLVFFLLAIRAV